jgi:hypothetical protein
VSHAGKMDYLRRELTHTARKDSQDKREDCGEPPTRAASGRWNRHETTWWNKLDCEDVDANVLAWLAKACQGNSCRGVERNGLGLGIREEPDASLAFERPHFPEVTTNLRGAKPSNLEFKSV